jgi:UDP-glucose 4-epimerase
VDYQIGDVRDSSSLLYALEDIDYVFHAAALKHVPASESNPLEYVKTNVFGSHNVLNALANSKVKTAVFLSTDKAVYPVNAMGMTKALMEKLVRSSSYPSETISCITRYGNVVGSRGSVIPLLISSIKHNRPIKITDWSMTRFIMSLEDSVDLVLHAMKHGQQGDLFVKKAAAADLSTILKAVETLLSKKAETLNLSGARPGEKIHETLLNAEEMTYAEETDSFFRVPSIVLNQQVKLPKVRASSEYASDTTSLLSTEELVAFLGSDKQIAKLL